MTTIHLIDRPTEIMLIICIAVTAFGAAVLTYAYHVDSKDKR